MKTIAMIVLLVASFSPDRSICQSAIGQLENITGQKINRYNTSGSSGASMDAMVSGMVTQSLLQALFSGNSRSSVPKVQVKTATQTLMVSIAGEVAGVEQQLRIDKYNRLMKTYKFRNNAVAVKYISLSEKQEQFRREKEAACRAAQKEIERLNIMKVRFQEQLVGMRKLAEDIEMYKREFNHLGDSAMKGFVDNILDVLPVDIMENNAKSVLQAATLAKDKAEGARLLSEATRLGAELSKTKQLNAATNLLLQNAGKKNIEDKDISQVILCNENFMNTGVLVEELAPLAGDKYNEIVKLFGKTLQFSGGALKIHDDLVAGENSFTWEKAGMTVQNIISIAGQFSPLVRITNAGEQLLEKTAFTAIAEYAGHQVSTSISQNEKARQYLNDKIQEIDNRIRVQEQIVNDYKKIQPAGCH